MPIIQSADEVAKDAPLLAPRGPLHGRSSHLENETAMEVGESWVNERVGGLFIRRVTRTTLNEPILPSGRPTVATTISTRLDSPITLACCRA